LLRNDAKQTGDSARKYPDDWFFHNLFLGRTVKNLAKPPLPNGAVKNHDWQAEAPALLSSDMPANAGMAA
jgi:hypothetical protein